MPTRCFKCDYCVLTFRTCPQAERHETKHFPTVQRAVTPFAFNPSVPQLYTPALLRIYRDAEIAESKALGIRVRRASLEEVETMAPGNYWDRHYLRFGITREEIRRNHATGQQGTALPSIPSTPQGGNQGIRKGVGKSQNATTVPASNAPQAYLLKKGVR